MSDTDDSNQRAREDEWIVVRCQLGERPAFDELIERWADPLWRYARRMTGEDDAAAEITQDVWLRALRGIGRLRDGAKLRAWLFGIARRVAMDRLRDKYATLSSFGDEDLSELAVALPDGDLALGLELEAMQHELMRLPILERDVLTLFYLRELSLDEVADVLGVPIGTVKSRLFRARKMLRRELESGANAEPRDRDLETNQGRPA